VDVFFFISAFLAGYLITQRYSQSGKMEVFSIYLLRIVRTMPSIIFVLLFAVSVYGLIGDGPVYFESHSMHAGE
jgi:peptidoglycan/LPS O-acetylase OafA/YrhL